MLHDFADLSARTRPALGSQLTTIAIGGQIHKFIEAQNIEEVSCIVSELSRNAEPFRIIGAGSNVLISSEGISEWVIRLGRGFRTVVSRGANEFEIGASMSLMALSRELSEQGFSGLEFAGGIPASVGGAIRMNAGAHGGQMADIVSEVSIVSSQGTIENLSVQQLNFRYRHAELPEDCVVVSAVLKLAPGNPDRVKELRAKFLSERKQRQPLTLPSAGSIFKNPPGRRAGECIDACDLRGFSIGKAMISEMHGNWIVNPERSASHQDVLDLMQHAKDRVRETLGIDLESEVVLWC